MTGHMTGRDMLHEAYKASRSNLQNIDRLWVDAIKGTGHQLAKWVVVESSEDRRHMSLWINFNYLLLKRIMP